MSDEGGEKKVTIVLSGKRFDLNLNDKESIQKMPWKDRKQLIDLLETIKQAEHVKSQAEHVKLKVQAPNKESVPKASVQIQPQGLNTNPQLDSEIKPSEADIDTMMERFVMEGNKDRPKIPDKSSVYKLLLIIMAVLLLISIIS